MSDDSDEVSTLAQVPYAPSSAPEASWAVIVVETGASVAVDGQAASRVLVGKSPACGLTISDPAISRRHAAFEPVEERLRITDLGSTNGTFVNGVAVVDAFLLGGEDVRVGATRLRIERGPPPRNARLSEATGFGRVAGWSREMRRLYPLCAKLAAAMVPVIIE